MSLTYPLVSLLHGKKKARLNVRIKPLSSRPYGAFYLRELCDDFLAIYFARDLETLQRSLKYAEYFTVSQPLTLLKPVLHL